MSTRLQHQAKPESQGLQSVVAQTLLRAKSTVWGVFVFSLFINLLMLTGPLYMLQVYDRVLLSGSVETLIGLTILMAVMFLFMGLLDWVRGKVLARLADGFARELSGNAFSRWLNLGSQRASATQPLSDLGTLQNFLSSNAPATFFDIPWAPIFIIAIYILHPMLGHLAVAGAVILTLGAIYNERSTRKPTMEALALQREERLLSAQAARNADTLAALGMAPNVQARWAEMNRATSLKTLQAADKRAGATAFTKGFRMFIQSAILGLGCYYAVQQVITPGAMIAGSIIMGRALAPIQSAIAQWRSFLAARDAHDRLSAFLDRVPDLTEQTDLPDPTGQVSVEQMYAGPPGARDAILQGIDFALPAGAGLGIVGPSASGKTTLARLLTGIWMPQRGAVRLDGATLAQYSPAAIRRAVGYLPQSVELLDGTIKDNISRFDPNASDAAVQEAAAMAGVHDMIVRMEDDYQTRVGTDGIVLSGGQLQRIALARAVYGKPKLVVLDEPNANLDEVGDLALAKCLQQLRASGTTVIVIAHRKDVLSHVDHLLVLENGKQVAFGPRDEVFKAMAKARGQRGSSSPRPQTAKRPSSPAGPAGAMIAGRPAAGPAGAFTPRTRT